MVDSSSVPWKKKKTRKERRRGWFGTHGHLHFSKVELLKSAKCGFSNHALTYLKGSQDLHCAWPAGCIMKNHFCYDWFDPGMLNKCGLDKAGRVGTVDARLTAFQLLHRAKWMPLVSECVVEHATKGENIRFLQTSTNGGTIHFWGDVTHCAHRS